MINVTTVQEGLYEKYSAYVAGKDGARFGHDLEWAWVLRDTYGVSVQHLVALEDEKVVGACPLFLCKPVMGGAHYLTSLFPSYFAPLYDSQQVLDGILERTGSSPSGPRAAAPAAASSSRERPNCRPAVTVTPAGHLRNFSHSAGTSGR